MKRHLCLLLFTSAGLLTAQDKPKDPFVKDKAAAAAVTAAAAPASPDIPKNILCLVETFTLPQADYAVLLDDPQGRNKLYDLVLAAAKAGTARLDGCHLLTNKSGTRSTLESVDELIYPTEWSTADRTGFQYPQAFEMHQLGDRFEFEPTLNDESGTLHIVQIFSRDRFKGMRLHKADATLTGVPVADLFEQRGVCSCRMIPGVPLLVETLNDTQPGNITLVFATAQALTLAAPKTLPPTETGNLLLTTRVISLDRQKGWELLKKHAADGAACLAALKPMLAAKEAALEHVSTICTQSGVRAEHVSGLLHTYGTQYSSAGAPAQPGADAKKTAPPVISAGTAGTSAFESRSLGLRIEVEPTLSDDRAFAHLVLAPDCVILTGNLKDKNWSEHYPELPLFSSQKVTTGYTQAVGSTYLISTLNPPGDTGANEHKDDGRIWLLFMDVNAE